MSSTNVNPSNQQQIPANEFGRVMGQMQDIMDRINQNLLSINDRICVLESRVDQVSKETKKMDEHVDFVSNLYQQVKTPFHSLMSYVGQISYYRSDPCSDSNFHPLTITETS